MLKIYLFSFGLYDLNLCQYFNRSLVELGLVGRDHENM